MSLAAQRCYNHPDREVVIRCLECKRFYCRECAGEYQDRFLCKTCLEALARETRPTGPSNSQRLWRATGLMSGLLCCWLAFYGLAQLLYSIPSYFHTGFSQHEETK